MAALTYFLLTISRGGQHGVPSSNGTGEDPVLSPCEAEWRTVILSLSTSRLPGSWGIISGLKDRENEREGLCLSHSNEAL